MKTLYMQVSDVEMREFDVDDDAVAVDVGGECPHHKGAWVSKVDLGSNTFECCLISRHNNRGPWVQSPLGTHAMPTKWVTGDGEGHLKTVNPYE